MLHMQHHILCNISYVVIAESMGKSLKYTTIHIVMYIVYASAIGASGCTHKLLVVAVITIYSRQ